MAVQPANLLFFLSDNHHHRLLGCYGRGHGTTPTLDRIAARGVRFDAAYSASPLCCPARAALATGRFPHQTGYWDNAIVYDGRVPSWMRRLREQGHTVTSVGKLHFRAAEDDNGFSEELLPMHILNGKGGVSMLLRGLDDEPVNRGQWELYMERSGIGSAPYQDFDRRITAAAVDWLKRNGRRERPWVLLVSYPSPHPPFAVPERLYRMHPEDGIALPHRWRPEERARHPGIEHLRRTMDVRDITDEAALRRIKAGYLGLIAHVDEQIGQVLGTLDDLGLAGDTRVLYTSDHGDLHGEHGLLGKANMYEGSIGVPMVMAGPGVPEGRVIRGAVSHVDLFPTIVEGAGGELAPEDADLPGRSLWPAVAGREEPAWPVFAEYHAAGSRAGTFMLRDGNLKLVYHVGMPSQLFDLAADPSETRDLVADGSGLEPAREMEARLRRICDPEEVDRRAKADQRAKIEFWGGREAVLAEGLLVYTPPPGGVAEIEGRGAPSGI